MHIIYLKVFCPYWHVGSVVYVTRGSAFWIDWLQPKVTKRKKYIIQKHKYTFNLKLENESVELTNCKDMTTIIKKELLLIRKTAWDIRQPAHAGQSHDNKVTKL